MPHNVEHNNIINVKLLVNCTVLPVTNRCVGVPLANYAAKVKLDIIGALYVLVQLKSVRFTR